MLECQLSPAIILILFIAIVSVEAITEIIVDSKIFLPFRQFISKIALPDIPTGKTTIFNFIHELISCGYCTSVWVAMFMTILLRLGGIVLFKPVVNEMILIFFLHRMSNLFHVLYQLILRGRVHTIDVECRMKNGDSV